MVGSRVPRCPGFYRNPDISDLVLVYIGFVRPLLEYACVIWHPGLTRVLSSKVEGVQKRALRIILGREYVTYDSALNTSGLCRLDCRRDNLCLRFARTLVNSERFSYWLPSRRGDTHDRSLRNKDKLSQFRCRTAHFANSTLPYCVKLLNQDG